MVVIVWSSSWKNSKLKSDQFPLRKKIVSCKAAIREIINAVEKLKYRKYAIDESHITLEKTSQNGLHDFFLITIGGNVPEEIAAILADATVKKLLDIR